MSLHKNALRGIPKSAYTKMHGLFHLNVVHPYGRHNCYLAQSVCRVKGSQLMQLPYLKVIFIVGKIKVVFSTVDVLIFRSPSPLLTFPSPFPSLLIQSFSLFCLFLIKTLLMEKAFSITAPRLWNTLSIHGR